MKMDDSSWAWAFIQWQVHLGPVVAPFIAMVIVMVWQLIRRAGQVVGWPASRIQVLDGDLGRSGASMVDRTDLKTIVLLKVGSPRELVAIIGCWEVPEHLRAKAADRLADLGVQARSVVTHLVGRLASEFSCKFSASALQRINPDWHEWSEARAAISKIATSVPYLIKTLAWSDDLECRAACSNALVLVEREALAPLVQRLDSTNASERECVEEVLNRIDPNWPKRPEAVKGLNELV